MIDSTKWLIYIWFVQLGTIPCVKKTYFQDEPGFGGLMYNFGAAQKKK